MSRSSGGSPADTRYPRGQTRSTPGNYPVTGAVATTSAGRPGERYLGRNKLQDSVLILTEILYQRHLRCEGRQHTTHYAGFHAYLTSHPSFRDVVA